MTEERIMEPVLKRIEKALGWLFPTKVHYYNDKGEETFYFQLSVKEIIKLREILNKK